MLDPSLGAGASAFGGSVAVPETSVVNAWIPLPQATPGVKLQFDRRVRIRNYSRLLCHLPVPGFATAPGAHWAHEECRETRGDARLAAARPGRGAGRLRASP